jgi:hypothetical protein
MVFAWLALLVVSGEPAHSQVPPPKPKLICREGESQTGSHVHTGARCLTAQQWEQEDARRDRVPVTLRVTAGQGDGQPAAAQPH